MRFLTDLYRERRVLWQLARNDCRARFAAASLGMAWAFLQPLLNILVLWFVFQVGFRTMPVDDVPFIVWYIPAFLSWNFFSEAVSQATNSLLEYSYLLKKVNFKVTMIPFIKVVSAGMVHAAFIVFIFVINLAYGRLPTLYFLQIPYYFLCAFCLSASLGLLLSALAVFLKDVANLVAVILQVGFWMTPLFWDPSGMQPLVQGLLKLNPMYYVCMGYRESIIGGTAFWQHPLQTAYFWVLTILLFLCGSKLFVKMKPHFVDML